MADTPAPPPAAPSPAGGLGSRTFVGLLVAQFFAAFNDQAIHAAAMFFAINKQLMTEADAISLMPILFYSPWAIFCTVAGHLADKYPKRKHPHRLEGGGGGHLPGWPCSASGWATTTPDTPPSARGSYSAACSSWACIRPSSCPPSTG